MSWSDPVAFRRLTTAAGAVFEVPEHIVRVDDVSPAGWQLRYGEWTFYADGSGDQAGVEESLQRAMREMQTRIEYRGK